MARTARTICSLTVRTRAAALSLGAAFLATPALALEAEPFAEAFKALIAAQDGALTYEGATLDGDAVTMTGVTIAPLLPAEGSEASVPSLALGDVTFEGVSETDIGYEAARLVREDVSGSFDDINEEGDDASYTIGRWGMEGITVPRADAEGMAATMAMAGLFYDRAFVEDATFSLNGETYVTLASIDTTYDLDATPVAYDATMTDLVTDLTVAADEDPNLKAWIDSTGYGTITTDYTSNGTWNLETGLLDADVNRITMEEIGELNLSFALGGLTTAFLESAGTVSEQMQSGDEQARQAAGMQILGLASQLQFGDLTLQYRDGGGGEKVLDYIAERNGQTKEELIQQTVGILPMMLANLQAPELQAQIQDAVSTFLNDPKSLTIALVPDAPVPAPVLFGAAASSPTQLATALNAQVRANDAGAVE